MPQGGYTLNQQQLKNQEHRKKRKSYLLKYDYLYEILFGFIIGQARISGFHSPALIYLTLLAGTNKFLFALAIIPVGAGLIISGDFYNLNYLGAGVAGMICYNTMAKRFKNIDISLSMSLLYLMMAVVTTYIQKGLAYRYVLVVIESVFIYILGYIGLEGMKEFFNKKKQLTRLALITFFLISGSILIGLSYIHHYAYFVINIIVFTFLMGLAYVCGFNYSLITGLSYGLILTAAGVIPVVAVVKYIIITFFCSLAVRKTKMWIGLGVLLGFLLYSGLAPTFYDLRETAIILLASFIIFMLIPYKSWRFLFSALNNGEMKYNKEKYTGEEIPHKHYMQELARVFNQLSVTFREAIPADVNNRAFDNFIYICRNKVCSRCHRFKICWQQEREDTLRRFFLLMQTGRESGDMNKDIVRKCLNKKCPYYRQITRGIKNSFELQQINSYWYSRIKEKQKIVSEQLAGIGEIISGFYEGLELTMTDNELLESLKQKAVKNNIDICSINLYKNVRCGRVYFSVEMENCSGNKPCQQPFLELLSIELDCNYRIVSKKCGNKMKDIPCRIIYGPAGDYQLKIAHILKPCTGKISGDNYLYKPLKDGKELVVISDGMGTGSRADIESQAAIDLLEAIIDAGFDQKLAIDTINSALYLRSQEENFTTLDICIFDTFTAEMTFSKIGAVDSYIKRGWELIKIESGTLPVGILDRIEMKTETVSMEKDDFVIMFSDGIMEVGIDIEDREEWLRHILQNCSFDTAGDMLNYIQEMVLNNSSQINDDFTIVVIKIEEVAKKRRKFKYLSRINIDD
ncbi:MAG: SpoIIE family protein phosphatase [Halanaerobiaceae bacterium]